MASRSSVARAEPRILFCRVMRVIARPTNGMAERVSGGGGGESGAPPAPPLTPPAPLALALDDEEALDGGDVTFPLDRLSLEEDVSV